MSATNTTLNPGDISSPTIALSAATVDTVAFGDDCDQVEVFTPDGTALIYFTTDGSTPAVGAKDTYVVTAAAGSSLTVPVPTAGGTVVKLISAGTPKYIVTNATGDRRSGGGSSSGGSGGPFPAALGAHGGFVVEGAPSGTPIPVSGALTISGNVPVTVAAAAEVDGHSATIGATSDASSANTLVGILKAVKSAFSDGTQKTKLLDTAGTNVAVINSGGALKVDPSSTTSPVSIAVPTTAIGYLISRLIALATTNATSVKTSAGQVYGWYFYNAAAYPVFLKIYNKASAPTVGTDTPVLTIGIPAGAAANVAIDGGLACTTGVAFAITKLAADADTTVLVAGDLILNLFYK